MSIWSEIFRIEKLRNALRTKLQSLSLVKTDATLSDCVDAVESIEYRGNINDVIMLRDQSVTIPAGYHSGGGSVGIVGSERQKIIASNIKEGVRILGVMGTYGADDIIPPLDNPATASDVRMGNEYVDSFGEKQTGTMPDLTGEELFQFTGTGNGVTSGLTGVTFTLDDVTGYVDKPKIRLAVSTIAYKVLDGNSAAVSNILSGIYPDLAVGKTLLGGSVRGTYTSDATAAAADILSGKTAYVNGEKLTGTMETIAIYTGSAAPSASLGDDGDIYFVVEA